jgi:hypothetical protein
MLIVDSALSNLPEAFLKIQKVKLTVQTDLFINALNKKLSQINGCFFSVITN